MNISPPSHNINFGKKQLPALKGNNLPSTGRGQSPIPPRGVIDVDFVELPYTKPVTVDDIIRNKKYAPRHKGLKALGIGLAAGLLALGALFGAFKLGSMTNNTAKEPEPTIGIEEKYNPSSDEVKQEQDNSSEIATEDDADGAIRVDEEENDSARAASTDIEEYGEEAAAEALEAGEIPLISDVNSNKEFEKWLVPHLQGSDTTAEFAVVYDNTDDLGNTINNSGYEKAFTNLAKGMIKQYSDDGNSTMSFDEMKDREKALLKAVYGEDYDGTIDSARLNDMFNVLDANQSGTLSSKELATYLSFLDMGIGYSLGGAEIGVEGSKNNFDGMIKSHENPRGFYLLSQYTQEPGKDLDANFVLGNGFE